MPIIEVRHHQPIWQLKWAVEFFFFTKVKRAAAVY